MMKRKKHRPCFAVRSERRRCFAVSGDEAGRLKRWSASAVTARYYIGHAVANNTAAAAGAEQVGGPRRICRWQATQAHQRSRVFQCGGWWWCVTSANKVGAPRVELKRKKTRGQTAPGVPGSGKTKNKRWKTKQKMDGQVKPGCCSIAGGASCA